MANGVKYVIMTVIFLAIVKLLQVTSFDSEKYNAMYKAEEMKYAAKQLKKKSEAKEKKPTKLGSKEKTKPKEKSKPKSEIDIILDDLKASYLSPLL